MSTPSAPQAQFSAPAFSLATLREVLAEMQKAWDEDDGNERT